MNLSDVRVAIIGHGVVGENHRKVIEKEGVRPEEILVVDSRQEVLNALKNSGWKGQISQDLPHDCAPEKVIVATHTPSHLPWLQKLARLKTPPHILCEKPAGLIGQQDEILTVANSLKSTHALGYLINTSAALDSLLQFMHEGGGVREVLKARAIWTKDRTNEKVQRPSEGDLEAEAVHPLAVNFALLRANQELAEVTCAKSHLEYADFVDREVQQAANRADASFPERPNSSTKCSFDVHCTSGQVRPVEIYSSFTNNNFTRRIEVLLGNKQGDNTPAYLAEVSFDKDNQDTLRIWTVKESSGKLMRDKLVQEKHFPKSEKLSRQWKAFETAIERPSERSPLLLDLRAGAKLMDYSQAILEKSR